MLVFAKEVAPVQSTEDDQIESGEQSNGQKVGEDQSGDQQSPEGQTKDLNDPMLAFTDLTKIHDADALMYSDLTKPLSPLRTHPIQPSPEKTDHDVNQKLDILPAQQSTKRQRDRLQMLLMRMSRGRMQITTSLRLLGQNVRSISYPLSQISHHRLSQLSHRRSQGLKTLKHLCCQLRTILSRCIVTMIDLRCQTVIIQAERRIPSVDRMIIMVSGGFVHLRRIVNTLWIGSQVINVSETGCCPLKNATG